MSRESGSIHNAKKLYQKGLRYPGVNHEQIGSEERITSGNGARISADAFAQDIEKERKALGLIEKALEAGDRDVLVSSEHFAVWGAERHARLKEFASKFDFDVKVILYLREQADIVVTHYFQHIKRGRDYIDVDGNSFQKFALGYVESRKYLDFDYLLTMLASVYGRENVIARTAKRSCLVGESLFLDSLDALGIDDDEGFDKNIAKVNPTPSQQEMYIRAVMGVFQPTLKGADAYLKVVSKIHDSLGPTGSKNDNFFIDPGVVQQIRERFSESNKLVCREWFGGRDVSEVLDMKSYGEKTEYDNNSMAINSVIAVFSGLLVDLQNRVETLESKKNPRVSENQPPPKPVQKKAGVLGLLRHLARRKTENA